MMQSPYLKAGAASIATALAEMEDIFQKNDARDRESILLTRQKADFLVYVNFIQENAILFADAGFGNDRQPTMPINPTARNRFVSLLNRVTKAHEGISRQERLFIHRFWSALQNSFRTQP